MASTITTEAGDTLMAETIAGIPSASNLNDISIVDIHKETFDTNPESRGWLIGDGWTWDSIDQRIEIV